MSRFRIVALRVLDGCPKHLCKALEPNKTYFFYEEYTDDKGGEYVKKKDHPTESLHMYDVKGENNRVISIEVSAIVGMNGEGKSSLVELILRLINNFAYSYGYRNNQNSLSYVNDLKAALYYEIEDQIYCIRCNQDGLKWMDSQGEIEVNGVRDDEKLAEIKMYHQQKLFYSLIINYSLYAYNSSLFKHEADGKPWLDGLFHKNDSYQTPLVLNPMRTNGDIDINNELHLARQRLMSIFTYAGDDKDGRMISDGVEAYGFCFKIDEEVKIEKVTLEEYFKEVENDVCTLKDLEGDNNEDNAKELLCNFNEFWSSFVPHLDNNPTLIDWLKNSCDHQDRREKTDLCKYLEIIAKADESDVYRRYNLKGYMNDFLQGGELEWMNYAQLYRLALVFALWNILVKDENVPIKGRIENYLCCKDEAWSKAALYIPYKIMEILTTYPQYFKRHYLHDPLFDRMKDRWPSGSVEKDLANDVKKIFSTNDYTTLKLHQTINYLKERKGDFYGAEECEPTAEGYHKFVTFENLKKEMAQAGQNLSKMVKRLPPPIFEGDIMLKESGKDMYPLSQISSGMMQRLNSVGALIYHLRNLDYRLKDNERVEYDYVSVLFEEVELYFHPEYQRTLINYLLKQIERAELKHIKGIHLIYVTHSPFILSDIPKGNVLLLKKGSRAEENKINSLTTFGANIYDMLKTGFFLNEPVGEYSKHVIEMTARSIRGIKGYTLSKDDIRDRIQIIDEPIVKRILIDEYTKRFDNDLKREYLEEELKKLNNRDKDVETEISDQH